MARFFTYRFGGVRQFLGPVSGLSYTFAKDAITRVEREDDASIFLLMGTADAGTYLFREVDISGNPIGPFPPIDTSQRFSMIDPKRFPSDDIGVTVKEWRTITEDLSDPFLYYHFSRKRLMP
jgi:hypothetical protein